MTMRYERRSIRENVLAAICVFLTGLIISVTAADLEKSAKASEEEKVSAAITFSPPEKETEKGFWDIFFQAVSSMIPDGI